jgi:hypothetical protein
MHRVRTRLAAAAASPPAQRWAPLARGLDPRLVKQEDWAATAAMLQRAHDQGHDISTAAHALVTETPLGVSPARDLRYRLVAHFGPGEPDAAFTDGGAPRLRRDPGMNQPPASPDPGRRDVRR